MSTGSKKGRPPGRKTSDRPVSDVQLSRCHKCGSTDRVVYGKEGHTTRIPGQGKDPNGNDYTAVLLSPTRCKACGQTRFDRRYVNEIEPEPETVPAADDTQCGDSAASLVPEPMASDDETGVQAVDDEAAGELVVDGEILDDDDNG